jgi:hypothetical protein
VVYKKVNPGDVIDIKDVAGVPYEGIYKGCREVSTNFGTQYIYKFQNENGRNFGIWGFTTLNTFMETILMGTQCRIIYTGQAEEPNKYGKHLHLCTVEIDEDDKNVNTAPREKLDVEKTFGSQNVDAPEKEESKKDFFEFMLDVKTEFKKKTGSYELYNSELSIFEVKFLSEVKGNTKKQADIRAYFEALLDDMRKGKI